MAQQIIRPSTAFAMTGGMKRPRIKAGSHLAFIRKLPCATCGTYAHIEAAHIRYGDLTRGKRETGAGEKPNDAWTVPLCHADHMDQHAHGEREWWASKGIDPLSLASSLFMVSGDEEAALQILNATRRSR